MAAAVAFEAISVLGQEKLPERSKELGTYFINKLRTLDSPFIKDIRGRGLFIGMEIDPAKGLPPKVLPWSPGLKTLITSSRARNTEIGNSPPPSALPKIKPSGCTSSC